MTIKEFRGQYRFLSSMDEVPEGIVTFDGVTVPTTEHGYQGAKFDVFEDRMKVYGMPNGYAAKSMAKHLVEKKGRTIRKDWDSVKVVIMTDYNVQKFTRNPELAHLLLETGDEEIIEGNNRGDTFWGVSPVGSTNGENHLGLIIMGIREQLARVALHDVADPAPDA